MGVFFFERRFQPLSAGGFSQTNGNRLVGAPRAGGGGGGKRAPVRDRVKMLCSTAKPYRHHSQQGGVVYRQKKKGGGERPVSAQYEVRLKMATAQLRQMLHSCA